MIPKVIHYCWLSGEQIPANLQKCIASWKEVLPDYELKLWDMNAFDVNSVTWVKEACSVRSWAFAADYIRLYALYTEGGIYLDSDVLVRKRFDKFLVHDFFTAIEYHPELVEANDMSKHIGVDKTNRHPGVPVPGIQLQAAILGAVKGHPFIKKAMEYYQQRSFLNSDGSKSTELVAPEILAMAADNFGFRYENIEQELMGNMRIYNSEVFAGSYKHTTDSTYAIHLCTGSWRERSIWRTIMSKLYFWVKLFSVSKK